jgi:hypothetical protein
VHHAADAQVIYSFVFGSECRWLLKPVGAVSGRCSKKPPDDAQNRAAREACFGALM